MARAFVLGVLLVVAGGIRLPAQTPETGEAMYRAWCAVCHGPDGRGRPPNRPVRNDPLDFTDCRTATAEPDADWWTVITRGGPAVGLSSEMPEFSVLTEHQVTELIRFVRSLCRDPRWPSGNLGFPRALFTTKALPEDEALLRPMVSHSSSSYTQITIQAAYERRVGRRGAVEISLPVSTVRGAGGRVIGPGDVAIETKYVLAAHERRGILTAGAETSFQTGSHRWDFGEGTMVFEPFVAAGLQWRQLLVQGDMRALLPVERFPTEPQRYVSYNASASTAFGARVPNWTVGVEITGTDYAVGIAPQISKRLTPSGALTAGFGVRVPITLPRPYVSDVLRWTGYLVWDYREPIRRRD